MYCRVCGARVGKSAAGFLRLLAKPCTCPGDYGKDNKKRLVEGRLPRGVKTWPCDDIVDVQTAKRVRAQPLSDFATQVTEDHPGLSTAEAKVVANTLLRCAVFAASFGSSSSSNTPSAQPRSSQRAAYNNLLLRAPSQLPSAKDLP